MSELARFNAKEQIVPTPVISKVDSAKQIENFLDDVSSKVRNFADEQAVQIATEQGAIAGEDPNFQPVIGFNKASKAFNKAALDTNKYITGAQIGNKVNELVDEARVNLNDNTVENFNASFQGYAEGVLSHTPSANHSYVKQLLLYHGNKGATELRNKLFNKNQGILANQFNETYNQYSNQMGNAAQGGDFNAAQSFHGQISALLENGLSQGLLTNSQYISYSDYNNHEFHKNITLGQFNKSFEDGKGQEYISNFSKSKEANKYFSPIEKESLIKKMQGIIKEHALASNVIQDGFADTINNMVIETKQGATIDPRRVELAKAAFPNHSLKIDTSLQLAHLYYNETQASKNFGIGDLQKRISELSSPPSLNEINEAKQIGVTASQVVAHRQSLLQAYNNQLKLLLNDPVAATEDNEIIKREKEKIIEGEDGDVNQKRLSIYQQFGLPEDKWRLLSKSQATAVVQDVRSVPFEDGLQKLSQIKDSFGNNWRYAYPAIYKDLGKTYELALAMKDVPESRVAVPDLQAALSVPPSKMQDLLKSAGSNTKNIDKYVDSVMSDYISTFSTYSANNLEDLESIKSTVRRMAYRYRLSPNHGQNDKSAAQEAFQAVIGNIYSEINRNGYRVPIGVDPNQVRRAIEIGDFQIEKARNEKELHPIRSNIAQISSIDFDDIIKTGHWVNDPTHENTLKFVDSLGVTVRRRDNTPFVINMNDLEFPDDLIDEFFNSSVSKSTQLNRALRFK